MSAIQGKVAIVTGGAQGLGLAIGTMLAQEGAKVTLADVKVEAAQSAAEALVAKGYDVSALQLDISDVDSIAPKMQQLKAKQQQLDIVINNAAIDVTKPIEELTIDEITKVVNVNLLGTFLMSKAALEIMYEQESGQVINIASTAAKRAWANASAYHATKWGIIGLSRSLYVEARTHNVRVSVVVPGGMSTPFILERFPDTDPSKLQDPANVAKAVSFVLNMPPESIVPEIMVLPLQESSWP